MSARRTLGRLIHAFAGLAGIAALAAGIPLLLAEFGRQPASWPSPGAIGDALLAPDDGTLLMTTLTVAGWVLWAWLLLPLLVELGALATRRVTPRLPGMAAPQRLAAYLLGALLLASPAAAASAATPAAATAPAAAGFDTHPPQPADTPAPSSVREGAEPTHTVTADQPTLWGIAEQRLGDGSRWKDIAALNPGIDRGHLAEGRVLKMPSDTPAQDTARASSAAAPEGQPQGNHQHNQQGKQEGNQQGKRPETYVVQPGNTLSGIAEQRLGDAGKWPRIAAANRTTVPDPDMIHPGDKLTIPHASPSDPESDRAKAPRRGTETPRQDTAQTPEKEKAESPAPGRDTSGDERTDAPERPADPPRATPAPPSSSADGPAPERASAPETDSGSGPSATVLAAGAGAAVLAAGVVGGLFTRRVIQQRRRRRGRRIPMPAGRTARAEEELRAVEPPLGLDALDAVLRTAAARLADEGRALPTLRAVVLGPTIELHLTEPAAPVAPFTAAGGHQDRWTCPAGTRKLLAQDELDQVELPLPGLVTLGTLEDGRLLLADLESIGVLRLTGPAAHLAARTLAVELAMTPLATEVQVRLPEHLAPGLPELCGERLHPYTTPQELLDAARAHHTAQQRALAATGCASPREARQGPAAGGWTPCIALVDAAAPGGPDLADQITKLAEAEPRTALAVILTSDTTEHSTGGDPDAGWVLHTTGDDAPSTAPGTDLEFVPNLLDDTDYTTILNLLATAAADHDVPGPDEPHPAGPRPAGPEPYDPDLPADEDSAPAAGNTDSGTAPAGGADPDPAAGPGLLVKMADLGLADETAPVPAPTNGNTPPQPPPSSAPRAAEPPVTPPPPAPAVLGEDAPAITVLGTVQVLGARGTVETKRVARATELLAYLACRPGADRHAVEDALWQGRPVSRNTVAPLISRTRAWLGHDRDGDYYFPVITAETRYALTGVDLDWTHFQHLVAYGRRTSGPDGAHALRQALQLVRGRPFAGIPPHRYVWAEPLIQDMIAAIVDAAELLAERYLVSGSPRDALWAAVRGLDAAPESEQLRRMQFTALAELGDHEGLQRAAAELDDLNDRLGIDTETATLNTLRDLMSRH